jgi:hypothetical protein
VIPTKASRISGTIGIFSLLITLFVISEAAAQDQYCECPDVVRTVAVRRAPARRVTRRAKVKRTYRTARVAKVRPVYRTVYVPAARVASYVAYADKDDCDEAYTPTARVVVREPVYSYGRVSASSYDTERIARGWGKRDGFKDGWKAALKYREYDPEDNGDYRDANNGYKERFGSKFLYRTAYREGYLQGYDSGFRSVSRGETYGAVRY